jgi:hypothetical protein
MPQVTAHNKIVLKAMYGDGGTQHLEGVAAAACTPGMNVVMTTAVETGKRHTYTPGAAAAVGGLKVVKEQILAGKTVDDVIPAGDNIEMHVAVPGDHVQARVASGQTIAKGAGLVPLASGLWGVPTGAPAPNPLAEALESSGGVAFTADTLMRVRVL